MDEPRNQIGAVSIYELFMLGLCLLVLASLAVQTFCPLDESVVAILDYVDTAVCVVFLADFVGKLATAKSKWGYLKWGWIDLVSSIPTIGPLRWGRVARVARIFILLRGVRSGKVLLEYILKRRAQSAFSAASLIALLLVVFASIAVLHFEREANSNIRTAEDALWWAVATITTVGYGDFYPVSTGGRIVAAVTMVAGLVLFGTFTGLVASWFLSPGEKEQESELELIRKRLEAIERHLEAIAGARAWDHAHGVPQNPGKSDSPG